jgi:hypothetical protein
MTGKTFRECFLKGFLTTDKMDLSAFHIEFSSKNSVHTCTWRTPAPGAGAGVCGEF